MGKRTRHGGGRSPSAEFSGASRLLRQRIVESGLDACLDADSVAASLRNRHFEYRRIKLQPFSHQVSQVLASLRHPTTAATSDDNASDSDGSTSSGTSSRRPNCCPSLSPSESRLQQLESDHLRRNFHLNISDRESDGSQSTYTSEGDGPDPQPAYDVTKSMLRDNYLTKQPVKRTQDCRQVSDESASAKSKSVKNRQENNLEIHMAAEKPKVAATNNGPVSEGGVNEDNYLTKQPVKRTQDRQQVSDDWVSVKSKSGKNRQKNNMAPEKPKVVATNNGPVSEGQEGKVGPRFADLGGMKGVIEELMMEVIVPLCHPQLPRFLGVRPMAGLLLHGPPGCGKTTLAHAIANETGVPFYKISAPEVVSGIAGASEENIRILFKNALRTAPSIVFIDEIDAIASKRENLQRDMERRIVTQLMTCMDQFHQDLQDQEPDQSGDKPPGYVLVIGATNRPDAVDQALRRPGRFDREIALGVPDEAARAEILSMLTQRLRLEGKFDLFKIARSTPGFVGADLKSLVDKAGNLAMKRITDKRKLSLNLEDWWRHPWDEAEMESLSITMADFEDAAKMVQPSLRREGFSSIPNMTWDDVGGLNSIRKVFERYIVQRIKHPEQYEELGINLEAGFLLFGPPGCGKTLIAKAVANEAGANFIHIKGPELLTKYVGESESAVRKIFTRARTNSPCIIFFDEVDALTTRRGKEGGWVIERLLNQLLIELDGADQRQGVYVIGATNRIEVMDEAVLRPGRFGKKLYVPLPCADERVAIIKAHAQGKPIDADVDLDSLARTERCNNLTGADLASLMNETAIVSLEERLDLANETNISYTCSIKASHFEKALSKISPSVSEKQREYYEALSKKY